MKEGTEKVNTTLPEYCYSVHNDMVVKIQRGVPGFVKMEEFSNSIPPLPSVLNAEAGVTPPQRAAMESGAEFGWDNLMASPEKYDEEGKPYDTCQGYEVKGLVRIGGIGIVFAENPAEVRPYVTWRVNEFGHFKDYYWGHYFSDRQDALKDFRARVKDETRSLEQRKRPPRTRGPEH